jgi:RNA-directed DNA polymerase
MKRAGWLIPRIADWNNLTLAFWKAARGRRYAVAVRRFQDDFLRQSNRLSREIRDGSVETGRFESFVIHDPKRRTIHAAPFRERMLHHAIMNVCGPHFERGAIDDSYACRVGKVIPPGC